MGWKSFDKYFHTVLNTTLRAKNKNKFETWFLYFKLFHSEFSRLPFIHNVKSDLYTHYIKRQTILCYNSDILTTTMKSSIVDYRNADNGLHMFQLQDTQSVSCLKDLVSPDPNPNKLSPGKENIFVYLKYLLFFSCRKPAKSKYKITTTNRRISRVCLFRFVKTRINR